MNHTPPLPAAVSRTRALAVGSTLALITLGLLWELWLAPTGRGTLALKVLPLALSLSGLLKLRLPTYRWVSLLVWLYVAEGAVRASTDAGLSAMLALIELALCLLLFTACALHVRARLRSVRPAVT
jgi:uncharacterized membrane protein